MQKPPSKSPKSSFAKYLMAGSGLAMLVVSGAVYAQEAAPKKEDEIQDVIVVGVRRSERSAIDRKKRAATTQDSIVADDVAQFPDKNVGEAISRIAGVALDRNEDGGTGGISIRGMNADLVRVEVNGMSTLNNTGDANGRSTNLTDLSSDLIKSVDVIKGQTADMTPGGIGGTVRIEQRNGLDFKKPYVQLNLQYQQMSLSEEKTPRVTLVGSRKFLNGRLGILANITYDKTLYGGDIVRTSNNNAGYFLGGDLDNSAEKTFVQPWDAAAAAVTTKAGCAALPTTGINSRANCYAQWSDYLPSLPRYSRWFRYDERLSVQLRADYKVTDNLTVFVNYNPNTRKVRTNDNNLSMTGPSGSISNLSTGASTTNLSNAVFSDNHFLVSGTIVGTAAAPVTITTQARDFGQKFGTDYLQTGFDYRDKHWDIRGRLGRSSGTYEMQQNVISFTGRGIPSISWKVDPTNGAYTYSFPASVNTADPSIYVQPANCTLATAAATQCAGASRDPYSPQTRIDYTPALSENTEDQAQIDFTRTFEEFGPLQSIKFGVQARRFQSDIWGGGGAEVTPGVYVPTATLQDNFRTCYTQYATTTTPCAFGTVAGTTTNSLRSLYTLTPSQFAELASASLIPLPGKQFLAGYPDRGSIQDSWTSIDVPAAFALMRQWFGLNNHNFNCVKTCTGSDGKTYDQPFNSNLEETSSAYFMANFDTRIKGVNVTGNLGVRYNKVDVKGTSYIRFNSTTVTNATPPYTFVSTFAALEKQTVNRSTADTLPSFNIAAWPIEDKLVVRYSKAKVIARPALTQITSNTVVTCNELGDAFDNFLDENGNDIDSSCTGRVGNPALKGYQAKTSNLSVEWYPNKDTQVSLGLFRINASVGAPIAITLNDQQLYGKKYDVPTWVDGPGFITEGWELSARTAFTFLPGILKYSGGGFNYSTSENSAAPEVDPLTQRMLPLIGQSKYYYNVNLWYDDGRFNARIAYQARDEYMQVFGNLSGTTRNFYTPYGGNTVASYFLPASPIFRRPTGFLDARASYKLNKTVELFWEGKNLTNEVIARDNSDYLQFDKSGSVPINLDTSYSGRRFFFGFRAKFE